MCFFGGSGAGLEKSQKKVRLMIPSNPVDRTHSHAISPFAKIQHVTQMAPKGLHFGAILEPFGAFFAPKCEKRRFFSVFFRDQKKNIFLGIYGHGSRGGGSL